MSDNTPTTPFITVHELIDDDGVVTVPVTVREVRGVKRFSFAFLRNLPKDGGVGKTHWLQRHHLTSLRKLIDKLDDWLQEAEEKARVAAARGR